jgi:hypothetical protein
MRDLVPSGRCKWPLDVVGQLILNASPALFGTQSDHTVGIMPPVD